MEVNRLLGDEVAYELQIRGLPIGRLVEENRTTLRGALRMERQGYSSTLYLDSLDPEVEYAICRQKLSVLGNNIDSFDRENCTNEYKRIQSRLSHIHLRLRRIPEGSEEQEDLRKALLGSCLQFLGKLDESYEDAMVTRRMEGGREPTSVLDQNMDAHRSILDDPNPLLPEIVPGPSINQPTVGEEEREAAQNLIFFSERPEANADVSEVRESDIGLASRAHGCSELRGTGVSHVLRSNTVTGCRRSSESEGHSAHPDIARWNYSTKRVTYNTDPMHDILELPLGVRPTNPSSEPVQFLEDKTRNMQIRDTVTNTSCDSNQPRLFELSRWKLQFDGESSVTSFLERVEEMRLARNASREQLLRSAVELFQKDALLWYRTQKFDTWDELVTKLKQDFLPYDYELDLWEEIRRRTQGARERVVTYVSVMENLFNRLGQNRPSEETRVGWIRRGLLPHIQTQLSLHDIHSVAQLTQLSRMVEETYVRTQKFCPPPTNYRSLLEPDLAYRKSSGSQNHSPCSAITTPRLEQSVVRSEPSPNQAQNSTSSPTCWNCGKTGHRFKKCPEARKVLFCFRCGTKDVTAHTCGHCAKNGRGGSR